VKEIELPDSVK